jgi:hypothetical protein
MRIEFDKSFEKWLSKITNKILFGKIGKVIIQLESSPSLDQVSTMKKWTGYKIISGFKLEITD